MKQEEYIKIRPSWKILRNPLEPFLTYYLKGNFDQIEKGKYNSITCLLAGYGITNEDEIFPFCTLVLYIEARMQLISTHEEESSILDILDNFNIYQERSSIRKLNFKGEANGTGFATSFKIENEAIIKLFINSVLMEFDRHEIISSQVTESQEDLIKRMGKEIFTHKGRYVIKGNNKRKKGRKLISTVSLQRELKTALERYLLSVNNTLILKYGEESYFIGKIFSIAGLIESESDYESRTSKGKESYSSYRDFLRRRIDSL
jgi:hypothetical protein